MDAFEVIFKNLNDKNATLSLERKKRNGIISELAYEYAKEWAEAENDSEFISSFPERVCDSLLSELMPEETAFFADRLILHLQKSGKKTSFCDFFGKWGGSRCAYVKNRYADMAYERFAAIVPNMTVRYVDDTDDVFNSFSQNNADCAIIPTESSLHGEIPGIYDRIENNELIALFRLNFIQTNSDTLTLSLVSKRIFPDFGGEYTMDVRFYTSEHLGIDMVLTAVGCFGCSIRSVFSSDGDGYRIKVAGMYDELYKLFVYLKIFTYGVYVFAIFSNKER